MTVQTIEEGGLAAFGAQDASKPRVVVFSASWCAPCKAMAPALEDISEMYEGEVAFGKVDIEAAPELAKSFGVGGVPTIVALGADGTEMKRLVGGQSKTRLSLLVDDLLDAAGDKGAAA